jgi:hypothetical protein
MSPAAIRNRWRPSSFLTRRVFESREAADRGVDEQASLSERDLVAVDRWIAGLSSLLAPGSGGPPTELGRDLLRDPDRTLTLLQDATHELRELLKRSVGRPGRRGDVLRAVYRIPRGVRLPDLRLLICLTADAHFSQFADGFWSVTMRARTDVRIDLRSACNAVWTWANSEFCPLAVALRSALMSGAEEPQPFPPFTDLYARVLSMHATLPGDVEERARYLSQFAVSSFRGLGPGREAERYLFAPTMEALRAHESPDVRLALDDPPETQRQRLANAVLPMFVSLRQGDLEPVVLLRQVTEAIELAARHADS